MTGVGVARGDTEIGDVVIELRSVNGRGLTVKARTPPSCAGFDAALDAAVRRAVQRGTVTVSIECGGPAAETVVDEARARAAIEELRRVGGALGLVDDLALSHLVAVQSLLGPAPVGRVSRDLPPQLAEVVDRAVAALVADRLRDGAATAAAVGAQLDALERSRQAIEARLPAVIDRYRAELRRRVDEFLDGRAPAMRDADVLREVALYADRADVGEELQRVGEHLVAARALLDGGGALGRRLEFVAQELQREINTTGSKVPDAGIGQLVVDMKAAVERVREQAANLE